METISDLDLELIFSLGDELEKKCESEYHNEHVDGHDDGPLYYARITQSSCTCIPMGIVIRCDGFLNGCEIDYADGYEGFICYACEGEWNIERLGPVE